jgi:hypothetical protein
MGGETAVVRQGKGDTCSSWMKDHLAMDQSEVAQLYHQIEVQLEAMRRGMSGFATGRARHAFIRAHMDNVGGYQGTLAKYVGEDVADQAIYSLYIEVMEREQ